MVERELSPKDKFFENLVGQAMIYLPEQSNSQQTAGPIKRLLTKIAKEFSAIEQLNDPQGVYSLCLTCEL